MGAIQAMAAMDFEAVAAERTRGLLQGALAAKRTEDALKICEDFEMEVSSTPPCPCRAERFACPASRAMRSKAPCVQRARKVSR